MRYFWNFKCGKLYFTALVTENYLVKLVFGKTEFTDAKHIKTPLVDKIIAELEEYFSGKRKHFDIPIKAEGTDFQKRVWEELTKIPYGRTISYKKLAENIGNPKAARAVGMANNKNPVAIIITCHRVIGSDGSLTGYAEGLELKKYLLDLESRLSLHL